jgi:arabinogalactan endo-1,4-beta-galactosidase
MVDILSITISFMTHPSRAIFIACVLLFPALASAVDFAYGADIGWLSEMEANSKTFKDTTGKTDSLFSILKQLGVNAIRLRVWVNPAAGYCSKKDVAAMAKRVKANGMRLMVDFHYSDTWADPSKQAKPAAWASYTQAQLGSAVYRHTYEVLDTLRRLGIVPSWVQVGNEVSGGMLWPTSSNSAGGLLYDSTNKSGVVTLKKNGAAAFAKLIDSGCKAVKAIDDSIKVIVHLNSGWNYELFKWVFDSLTTYKADYDMIGMSFYPSTKWRDTTALCLSNMKSMVSRYSKPVVISEVGMSYDQADSSYAMLKQLITDVKSLATGYGIGIFYWEPEAYNDWNSYPLGAFDNTGKPTKALYAFAQSNPYTPTTAVGSPTRAVRTEGFPSRRGGVRLAGEGSIRYVLRDLSGKVRESGTASDGTVVGASLPEGTYLVRTTDGTGTSAAGPWARP